MSREDYRAYLERGPDAVGFEVSEKALRFRDEHPAEARAVAARFEEERREAEDRQTLRSAWVGAGGDERAFEREWPKIKQEHEAARLRELDRSARETWAHDLERRF